MKTYFVELKSRTGGVMYEQIYLYDVGHLVKTNQIIQVARTKLKMHHETIYRLTGVIKTPSGITVDAYQQVHTT